MSVVARNIAYWSSHPRTKRMGCRTHGVTIATIALESKKKSSLSIPMYKAI